MCEYLGLIKPEIQMLHYNNPFIIFIYIFIILFIFVFYIFLVKKLLNNFYYKKK